MGDFSFRAVEVLKSVRRDSRRRHATHAASARPLRDHDARDRRTTSTTRRRRRRARRAAARAENRWRSSPTRARRCSPIPGRGSSPRRSTAGIAVVPIPGASALLAALVASGLDVDRFTFFGFLTRTGSERRAALDEISTLAAHGGAVRSAEPAWRPRSPSSSSAETATGRRSWPAK